MFGRTAGQFLGTMLPFFSEQTLTQGSPSGGTVIPAAIHFWPMNEGSGTTFFDQIGTTNLTSTNVTYAVTTGLGASSVAQFNGAAFANAAAVDSTLNFSGTQPMTVAYWTNQSSNNSGSVIGDLATGSSFQGWEVGTTGSVGSATPNLLVVGAVGTNQMTAVSSAATGTGAQFVVYTYSGSLTLAGVRIYINGTSETLTDQTGTLTSGSTSTVPVYVGSRNNGTSFYTGALAYMRVWNQVLTPAQVTKLFSNGPQ